MNKPNLFSVSILTVLATVASSAGCGDDNDTPAPTPTDVPGEALDSWTRVRVTGDAQLTVNNDGTTSESDVTVTQPELRSVAFPADALASAETLGSFDCQQENQAGTGDDAVPAPQRSYTITVRRQTGDTVTVVQSTSSNGEVCTRGDRAQALSLRDAMIGLADRYNGAQPSPTPSPSPTPTQSPSPEPTVTILPTPTPPVSNG